MTTPTNELAVARSLRALDVLAKEHPELVGDAGPDNAAEWFDTLAADEEGTLMPKESTVQVAFRLPPSLIARLDRHAERMNDDTPGMEFSRADAVRTLLTRALDQIEGTKRSSKRATKGR